MTVHDPAAFKALPNQRLKLTEAAILVHRPTWPAEGTEGTVYAYSTQPKHLAGNLTVWYRGHVAM